MTRIKINAKDLKVGGWNPDFQVVHIDLNIGRIGWGLVTVILLRIRD